MTDHTPTMKRIEDMYAWAYAWRTNDSQDDDETDLSGLRAAQRAEFQRALAAHDRKIAAEAWDEGRTHGYLDAQAHHGTGVMGEGCGPDSWDCNCPNPYRADRIEQGGES